MHFIVLPLCHEQMCWGIFGRNLHPSGHGSFIHYSMLKWCGIFSNCRSSPGFFPILCRFSRHSSFGLCRSKWVDATNSMSVHCRPSSHLGFHRFRPISPTWPPLFWSIHFSCLDKKAQRSLVAFIKFLPKPFAVFWILFQFYFPPSSPFDRLLFIGSSLDSANFGCGQFNNSCFLILCNAGCSSILYY